MGLLFKGTDRRKGPDIWIYILRISVLFGWLLFVVAMVISHYASPETDFGLVRYHNIEDRRTWLNPLTDYLYIILWVTASLSIVAIVINHFRSRRNDDFAFFNLFLLLIASLAWAVYLIFNVV